MWNSSSNPRLRLRLRWRKKSSQQNQNKQRLQRRAGEGVLRARRTDSPGNAQRASWKNRMRSRRQDP